MAAVFQNKEENAFYLQKLSCFKVAEYVSKKKTSMVNLAETLKFCNWKSLPSKRIRHMWDLFLPLVMGTDSSAVSQLPLSPCQWQERCWWWKLDFPGCPQCPKTKSEETVSMRFLIIMGIWRRLPRKWGLWEEKLHWRRKVISWNSGVKGKTFAGPGTQLQHIKQWMQNLLKRPNHFHIRKKSVKDSLPLINLLWWFRRKSAHCH